jgi:UDP-N-acetylmuramoyl-tripeptide--D-alanyl-D-alanine ligase
MGIYNRKRSRAKIVGVTGSVGKTSTKEMLKIVLASHGRAYATSGNYNNHIGTPLNLANMPLDTQYAVLEIGMNHAGEISYLTNMVRPHVAMITCVEAVHLEFFENIHGIAKAKAEIFEGLDADGIAVINVDQPYFLNMPLTCAGKTVTFGESEKADCRLMHYTPSSYGCEVVAEIDGQVISYDLSATGKHWAITSVSVLAVIKALGLDISRSAQALSAFSEVDGRGKVLKKHGCLLINDSYNASPASMKSAFTKTDEVWQMNGKKGRKIAILGDMLELGEAAAAFHAELAQGLISAGFDKVYCSGELMQHLFDALPEHMRAGYSKKAMELLPLIQLKEQDVVLIKGSHGSKMYELADNLMGELKNAV